MGIFGKKDAEPKAKEYHAIWVHLSGLPEYHEGDAVKVTMIPDGDVVRFNGAAFARPEIVLGLNKIQNIDVSIEKQTTQKNKSVIGRAAVGSLVGGPVGAVVGGISGTGKKEKAKNLCILTIGYAGSNEPIIFDTTNDVFSSGDKIIKAMRDASKSTNTQQTRIEL